MVKQYVLCETPFELSNVMQINLGIQGVVITQIPSPAVVYSLQIILLNSNVHTSSPLRVGIINTTKINKSSLRNMWELKGRSNCDKGMLFL